MLNQSILQSSLYKVVGLRQPYSTAYAKLDADNITSRSGYYANDNPLAKIEFLYDNLDFINSSDAQFNDFAKKLQQSAISNVCSEVFNEIDLIDRQVLYKNAINKEVVEDLVNGFVGYKINIGSEKNISFEINRIMLNFHKTGSLKLLLFNSSIDTPIFTKNITITSTNQIELLEWKLDNTGNYYKGEFYLGYIVNNNSLEPFKRVYQDANLKSKITNLCIENIAIAGHITESLWDLSKTSIGSSYCFGLNPDIVVYYDYTDLIIRTQSLFAKAINIAFQIKIIESYLATVRSNRNERISQDTLDRAILEIEGVIDSPGTMRKKGLRGLLYAEISSLRNEVKKLKGNAFGGSPIKMVTLS